MIYAAPVSSALTASPFRLPAAPLETDLVAKYFRGLGDPIRLRLLELLQRDGELSVGELVERLGLPQPQVSNHLACLRWCGFVEARREGRTVVNRIADARVERMLELAQSLLADNAEHIAACCRIEEPGR
jgi:ArsR family transcriptional regulator, cadmium/lead-responsive transcriptional repressor